MVDVRLLVGGMARSGTTVAQRLLSELDGVWVAPETHFWRYAPELARRFSFPLAREEAVAALTWLTSRPSAHYLDVDPRRIRGHLTDGASLWDLFVALVRALSPEDAIILGEKTPDHLLWAPPLMEAVPTLEVIGIVRDPRSVLRSHQEVPWGIDDVDRFASKWVRHSRNLRWLRQRHPSRTVAVRFEDLAADPERFQGFLARRFDTGCRTRPVPGVSTSLFDAEEWWKTEALGEIAPRPPRWQSELPRATLARLERSCGAEMSEWGYAPLGGVRAAATVGAVEHGAEVTWSALPIVRSSGDGSTDPAAEAMNESVGSREGRRDVGKMSVVKRGLSLIPRDLVARLPRAVRDRWRTRLLLFEQRIRRRDRQSRTASSRAGAGDQTDAPGPQHRSRPPDRSVGGLEGRLDRIETRLVEAITRLDQIESRMSIAASGEHPSPLDDLADLVRPIEELRERLDALSGAVPPVADPEVGVRGSVDPTIGRATSDRDDDGA